MTTPSFQQQVEQLTATFAAELVRVMKSAIVQSVADAVGGPPAAARAQRAPTAKAGRKTTPAPAAKPTKGQKRSPKAIARTTAALAAYVAKNPGQRIEQIAQALQTPTQNLSLPAHKLIAAKKILAKGKRRATRYFPA
jgi:hypothetical protein